MTLDRGKSALDLLEVVFGVSLRRGSILGESAVGLGLIVAIDGRDRGGLRRRFARARLFDLSMHTSRSELVR
jgi:hypothetical protein